MLTVKPKMREMAKGGHMLPRHASLGLLKDKLSVSWDRSYM